MALLQKLPIDDAVLASFCQRWKIAKLELFGSFARGEQRADSDIDLLVTYAEDANWGLFEHVRIQDELSELLGRTVDLVSKRGIEASNNQIRRTAILKSATPVYVAVS